MHLRAGILSVTLAISLVLGNSYAADRESKPAQAALSEMSKPAENGWKQFPPTIKIYPQAFEVTIAVTPHPGTDPVHLKAINFVNLEDAKGYLLGEKIFSSDEEIRNAEFMIDRSKTETTDFKIIVNSSIDGQIVHDFNVNNFGEGPMGSVLAALPVEVKEGQLAPETKEAT